MNHQDTVGPISLATPVRFRDELPQAADVMVIGGGVIGATAALFLIRRGLSVVLCEKGRIAGEQSSRNWGWIRKMGRDEAEMPVMIEASRLWEQLDRETAGRTGFQRKGIAYLASNAKTLDKLMRHLEVARKFGVELRQIDGDDARELIKTGEGGQRWLGGLWSPTDGRGEPWQAVPALAELAHSQGLIIREDCAVRAFDVAGERLKGIHTEAGYIRTEQAVLAGGAWSALLLKRHGISIPQLSVRATVARMAPMPSFFDGSGLDEEIAIRRREDGGYTVAATDSLELFIGPDAFRHLPKYLPMATQSFGLTRYRPWAAANGWPDGWRTPRRWAVNEETPFERCRVLEPEPDHTRVEKMRRRFADRFDGDLPEVTHTWAGLIDTMPDAVPIIDRVPNLPGLIVATGMSGHGFGIGPGFGKIVADMAADQPIKHDMKRFRFSRFSDGSRIDLGPAI